MNKFLEEPNLNELEDRVEFSVCGLNASAAEGDGEEVNNGSKSGDPDV